VLAAGLKGAGESEQYEEKKKRREEKKEEARKLILGVKGKEKLGEKE
jgi:hypothetical protein